VFAFLAAAVRCDSFVPTGELFLAGPRATLLLWGGGDCCAECATRPHTHRQNNGHPEREEIPFRPLLRHGA